jgi:DNA (cytosine-5)-methyltransferase 1
MARNGTTQQPRCAVRLVKGPFVRPRPHPEHCEDEAGLARLLTGARRRTAVDLFCGAGGLSLGLREAGFDVVMGIDSDKEAIETHSSLFPGLSATWDLSDQKVIDRVASIVRSHEITLVAGAPPCQPFSSAGKALMRHLERTGKRNGKDDRRDLWQSFLAVVEQSTPPAVLMENVPEIALDPSMGILRAMVSRLEEIGYRVHARLVETWRHGVPQFRERFFLVALREDRGFQWPEEGSQRVTVANAIGDLPAVEGGARPNGGAEGFWDYNGPRSEFQKRARARVGADSARRIYDHVTRPVRDDDRAVFMQMDSKTKYSDIPEELKRYRDDIFTDKYKRLDADDLCRTITAHISKDGYWYIHPSQPRTLTVREAARIQTFADDVRFAGPPSSAFRQIGNAVPPLMAECLGRAILEGMNVRRKPVKRPTTTDLAEIVGECFRSLDPQRVPWLRASTRWQVIQAELLFDRVRPDLARKAWPIIAPLRTPAATVRSPAELVEVAGFVGRQRSLESLLETARHFADHPAGLRTVESMQKAPHVDSVVATLAAWVVPGREHAPVAAGSTVLRVANRVLGAGTDQRNRSTDGRIAIARMIGDRQASRDAFLGLVELGRSLCRPQEPLCHECPLAAFCSTGSAHLRRRPTLF